MTSSASSSSASPGCPASSEPAPTVCPRAEWTRQPVAGHFSLVEHCCHLRDLEEEGYTLRLRRMLREDAPVLDDFDGGAVAARRATRPRIWQAGDAGLRRGPGRNLVAALDAGLRAALCPDGDLRRARDRSPFERLAELMAEHDAGHRAELEAFLTSLGQPTPR